MRLTGSWSSLPCPTAGPAKSPMLHILGSRLGVLLDIDP